MGQNVVLPHSLKMVARAELTSSKLSRLSMIDWSTAGAIDDDGRGEGAGFCPFPFFIGAMATGRGRFEIGLEAEIRALEEEEQGTHKRREEG